MDEVLKEIENELDGEDEESDEELDFDIEEGEEELDTEDDEELDIDIEDDEELGIEEDLDMEDEEGDEELDIDIEDDDEDMSEVYKLRRENRRLTNTIKSLKRQINEVNLFRTKMKYLRKLESMVNSTSTLEKISEAFDKANTLHQVKLTYYVLKENLNTFEKSKKAQRKLNEARVNVRRKPITENVNTRNFNVDRLKKLAGIK
jgi:hypothetical protein